jgi:transposase
VSADKAYLSRDNFYAVSEVGGTFYPAFKVNTTPKRNGPMAKAYAMFIMHQEEYEKHYHLRSNAESCFSAIKRKLGESLKSKTLRALQNEALAKVVAYNITCVISAMYELGIDPAMGCTKTNTPAQILPPKMP